MKHYSKNKKLNGVLNEIRADLLQIHDTKAESVNEIKRYIKEFEAFPDYNIAAYGNVLIYYSDVQELYKRNGYKTKFSDWGAWETYRRHVGYIARMILKESQNGEI